MTDREIEKTLAVLSGMMLCGTNKKDCKHVARVQRGLRKLDNFAHSEVYNCVCCVTNLYADSVYNCDGTKL